MTDPNPDQPTITNLQYMDRDGRITDEPTKDTVHGTVTFRNPDGSETIAQLGDPLGPPPVKITKVTPKQ